MLAINLILFVALSFFMVRIINARHARWATQRVIFLSMLGLGAMILWQREISLTILDAFGVFDNANDFRGFSADYPLWVFVVGNFLMAIFIIWKRADMRRWFLTK